MAGEKKCSFSLQEKEWRAGIINTELSMLKWEQGKKES